MANGRSRNRAKVTAVKAARMIGGRHPDGSGVPRHSARMATLREAGLWCPSRAGPCSAEVLRSRKFRARTVRPHRRTLATTGFSRGAAPSRQSPGSRYPRTMASVANGSAGQNSTRFAPASAVVMYRPIGSDGEVLMRRPRDAAELERSDDDTNGNQGRAANLPELYPTGQPS